MNYLPAITLFIAGMSQAFATFGFNLSTLGERFIYIEFYPGSTLSHTDPNTEDDTLSLVALDPNKDWVVNDPNSNDEIFSGTAGFGAIPFIDNGYVSDAGPGGSGDAVVFEFDDYLVPGLTVFADNEGTPLLRLNVSTTFGSSQVIFDIDDGDQFGIAFNGEIQSISAAGDTSFSGIIPETKHAPLVAGAVVISLAALRRRRSN